MRVGVITVFLFMSLVGVSPTLAKPPQRVVSLGPIITEMIYLLEADQLLIANTNYCKVPEAARHKIKIGSMLQMNMEKSITLEPDIVLASALTSLQQIALLKKMDIKVVRFENPETFLKMCTMLEQLGQLLNKEAEAVDIIAQAQAQVAAITHVTADLPPKKVFIQIGLKPLHTSPKGTFINEYIEFAGGINVAAGATSGNYSRETVLEKNPDIILIATMGSSKNGARQERETWLSYHSLTATRNRAVYVLDPEIICSPTPVSFAEALRDIASLIHPETVVPTP